MANNYFRFKQFTIYQGDCAMKVTTLACLQGGWLPAINPDNVLDIGAGTGLLSHMVAQKFDCNIDAVEIEASTFNQLKENTAKNPWQAKITCHHQDIHDFANHIGKQYDFIISNPPFFSKQFKSQNTKINIARHENTLVLDSLLPICNQLLSSTGLISILLPPFETNILNQLSHLHSLYISEQMVVFDSENKPAKAIVSILSRKPNTPKIKNLIIKSDNGTYSADFISLLKDYYLYL